MSTESVAANAFQSGWRAQEVETTEKNMITEKGDAVRDRVKRARDNLRVKVHMHMYTYCCRECC